MFLFYNGRGFVILLIEILLLILSDDNGRLTKEPTTVAATQQKNTTTPKPSLQIKKHPVTRLTITKLHTPYFLPCQPLVHPDEYYQNNAFFCTWYRNDEAIEHLSIRKNDFFIYKNGTLRLPPNERASGVYHCKIESDEVAVISDSVTVEYPVLKRLTPGSQVSANISAYEGQPLALHCPMYSVPAAHISWYFGNESLANDNSVLILANGTLILRQLRLEHAGKYKCVALNQFANKGHRQYVWTLWIESSGQPPVSAAQLLPELQNATQYVPTSGSLVLQCRAVADFVAIEWWFQNSNNTLTKLSNNSVSYAIINASMVQHEGHYTCVTPLDRQTFHVLVTTAPRILNTLPVEVVSISLPITLSCRAEGNPRPTLTWYHNGAQLNSSYTRYISSNTLEIHSFDPEEEGIYQCFARNVAGEDHMTGEILLKQQLEQPNPLQNIRCYPHSFNAINVTFDSRIMESLFVVHIVRSNPHNWSSLPPMKLNHTSYVIISNALPAYRPFALITRVLFPTSEVRTRTLTQQRIYQSSLRSPPVTCCTQGLLLLSVHIKNDTFVFWSQAELETKKYFILQFSINHTHPHPEQLLKSPLIGTVAPVDLNEDIVRRQLTTIEPLNQTAATNVLRNAEHEVLDNEVDDMALELEEDIFSLVVDANVTGLLLQHFTRIKMRVLIITSENEYLGQDFRYVRWKIIENNTSAQSSMPFRLTTRESRMLAFQFQDSFNDTCVYECHLLIQMALKRKEEPKCKERTIMNSILLVNGLFANNSYNFHFYNCENHIFYGQIDVKTLPDPPGTINNSRLIVENGLKLVWDPPNQPNGQIHHYNIVWTLGNVTHETNVFKCNPCSYKFPNVSETDLIHVAVRVLGDTGVGAPMYFDLTRNNHHTLERERSSSNSEVYSGIAIGSMLSLMCVFGFALFIIFQRRRFKARQQGPTHLTTPTDINFGNLSNTVMPGDSAGGLSGSTLQQDCHEMQTLIPRSRYHIELLPEHTLEYQTSTSAAAVAGASSHPLPNGNGNGNIPSARRLEQESQMGSDGHELSIAGVHNLSQMPLCSGSPEAKSAQEAMLHDAKAFYIPYRHTPPNAVALQPASNKQQSSSLHANGAELEVAVPPSSLPLVSAMPGLGLGSSSARRSCSLSSSSTSSSSNGSKKQYHHTNFPKHSNSNDGICLLAEEESAATLTPTSEHEYVGATLTNGFKLPADMTTTNNKSSKTLEQPVSKLHFSRNNNSNNNNGSGQKGQTAVTQLKDRQQRQQQNSSQRSKPISFSHNTSSIVPANGPQKPLVAVNATSNATASATAAAAAATTSTMLHAKQPWPATTSVHRRAQVDPNG
ncbi:uncharacterized protein LOC115621173 [Scaptodrosophila lebanonensis]|uniref:Uncharacterized protein LOC115621173 n=1 Tax=Drosophila lebanonensis TaxID=7225 RepID=A0A6J2T6Q0_DROLE|nr:uncharacterized protein LOC115621173 [Scaptodrosophila lebanonensis]